MLKSYLCQGVVHINGLQFPNTKQGWRVMGKKRREPMEGEAKGWESRKSPSEPDKVPIAPNLA